MKEIKVLRLFEEVPKKVAPIEGDLELVVPIGEDLELLEHEVVASGLHRVKVDVSAHRGRSAPAMNDPCPAAASPKSRRW